MDAVWASFDIYPPSTNEWAHIMTAGDCLLAYEATYLLERGDCVEKVQIERTAYARTTSVRSESGFFPNEVADKSSTVTPDSPNLGILL